MNFPSLLPDLKAIDETRNQLYYTRAVLKEAVHFYAKGALDHAQDVLEVALASGPMVDTYHSQHEYNENMRRCREAIQASNLITQGILNIEETTDPGVDESNAEYKEATMEFTVISAMMEAATTRMNLAVQAFPDKPRPGALCNGSVFVTKRAPESDEEPPDA